MFNYQIYKIMKHTIKKAVAMKTTFNCYADCNNGFMGFYNSYDTLLDSQIENEIEDYHTENNINLEWDDFSCNMSEFKKEVCEKWCEGLQELLGKDCNVKYKDYWSPTSYNYSSDEIHFELSLDKQTIEEIIRCLYKNEKIAEIIKKRWSSRDGFCSFMSSDAKEWGSLIETYIETGEDNSSNNNIETYISLSVYYWLVYEKGKDVDNYLWQTICEEIDFGMFIELNETGKMKVNKGS